MIIFEEVVNFILDYVSKDKRLSLDNVNNYNDKKLVIGISLDNDPVISIEILPTGVCDMIIIDFDTENIKCSITKEFIDIQDLKEEVTKFLKHNR